MGITQNQYNLNSELGCIDLLITSCSGEKYTILIDVEDWVKIKEYIWIPIIPHDEGFKTYFTTSCDRNRLQRFILNLNDSDPHVVFKNGNNFDLRKTNLGYRGVRGLSASKPGKTGITGVHYYVTDYKIVARYKKRNGKYASKSLSLNIYDYNEAINIAKEWREEMIKRDV